MLERHGIAAYAVSYDPVEVLAQLTRGYDVAYPLLSDAESRVIRQLGLLNSNIPPGHPWHGVPYPGTLLLDEAGRVLAKSFYPDHRSRDSVARLLEDAFGVAPDLSGAGRPVDTAQRDGVTATATLSAGTIRPGQVHSLTLVVALRSGQQPAARGLLADPAAVEVALAPVEGIEFGPVAAVAPVAAAQETAAGATRATPAGRVVLRASVTAARRRDDFVVQATVRLPGDGRPGADQPDSSTSFSLSLPVRFVPNAAPAT
ncbi:MAG: redoxin domain-containing protein [Chloroflexi bacterium]|nr:redoxin domain-containing protein [Chloroflexota bacterium]